jgi:GntR family transcriptional repressor for pyruvate dehydrogenase complex
MFKQIASSKINFQIMNQIKEKIRSGELQLGDRLPSERTMAEQLGVSRATVREAIRSMELMGLVICVQGEGNFIPESLENSLIEPLSLMFMLNRSHANEISELRRALEIEAVRLAAEKISEGEVKRLEESLDIMENSDIKRNRVEADHAFHDQIAKASGNMLIINLLNSLSQIIEEQMAGVRANLILDDNNLHVINQQHRLIFKALEQRDRDEAITAMTKHMDYVNRRLK